MRLIRALARLAPGALFVAFNVALLALALAAALLAVRAATEMELGVTR